MIPTLEKDRLENVPMHNWQTGECTNLLETVIQHYFLESVCAEVTLKSVCSLARNEPMPGYEVGTFIPENHFFNWLFTS